MEYKILRKELALGLILFILVANGNIIVGQLNSNLKTTEAKNPKIIYVDDDNTEGPWNGTLQYPYRFIDDGVDAADPGDTVFVFNGEYIESVLILQGDLTLIGENKNTTFICYEGELNSDVVCVGGVREGNVTIDSFTIISNKMCHGVHIAQSNNIEIINCEIRSCLNGVFLDRANECHIINSIIYDSYDSYPEIRNIYNDGNGILLLATTQETCNYNMIEGCIAYNNSNDGNSGDGIDFTRWQDGVPQFNIIKNCSFYQNQANGIHLDSGKNNIINCSCYDNGGAGIFIHTSDDNIIYSCDLVNNSYGIYLQRCKNSTLIRNHITNNTKNGVYLRLFCNKNQVINNDIFDNRIDAFFQTSFSNEWRGNYWGKHFLKIKIIFGIIGAIPWVNIDKSPASQPCEIPKGYLNLSQIITELMIAESAFPKICKLFDLTTYYNLNTTYEGRHIFALKISDNVQQDEDEPTLLLLASHHSQEIVTPVIALYAIEQLTTCYGIDPHITQVVNEYEIWISPVWNPDGYEYMFYYDTTWRKNRQPLDGVDLNRNYPFGWNSLGCGSSNPYSRNYKGPSSASEPETQTMLAFASDRHFTKVLDYHSSGREVLYGYRFLFHPFAKYFLTEASSLSVASGYHGSVRKPSANGENYQYHLAFNGSYAYLIESQMMHQPPYADAVAEAATVWPGMLWVLEKPIPISGHVIDADSHLPLVATITLKGITFLNGEYYMSEPMFGRYHLFLPEGTYTVTFSAEGHHSQSHRVTVSSTAEILDITLQSVNTTFSN